MLAKSMFPFRRISKTFKRRMSVLYMTGDKAKENFSPISPFIDFKTVFSDTKAMEQNLEYRNSSINFKCILDKYNKFNELFLQKRSLEKQRDEITSELKNIQKTHNNEKEMEILKVKGKTVRNNLQSLKEALYPIENDFIVHFLELPNDLSPKCPTTEHQTILLQNGQKMEKNCERHHLDHISVKYKDEFNYYLQDEIAEFDINFSYKCFDHFLSNGYSPVTTTDFTKRVLTEAFGSKISKYENLKENPAQINFLQLTGGGSSESFLGLFAKLSVFPSIFPIKLISIGKNYEKSKISTNEGVYNSYQSNRVQIMNCYRNSEESDSVLDEILKMVVDVYKSLNIHFKIVYLPARELEPAESLAVSVQMYSPSYDKYFEIGRISDFGNYVSKRMLFNFKENRDIYFGNMVAGTIVNTTRLAMILIENGQELNLKKILQERIGV